MGIFDIFKKGRQDLSNSKNTGALSTDKAIALHPDLEGLVWIADGKHKNYSPGKETYLDLGHGIKMPIPFSVEPSVISLKLPIQKPVNQSDIPKMPYYPSYAGIDPLQRWAYWEFLRNPYNSTDIGYVFTLYYGLERHLLIGDFEKAFDVILKLRNFHKNNSFLWYSSTALILSCIQRKSPDHLGKYLLSIDDTQISTINISLFLLCLHTFGLELTPRHIMYFAKGFAFENNRYIKNHPDIFASELEKTLLEINKTGIIDLQNLVKNFRNTKSCAFTPFANPSLRNKENDVTIPDLTTDIKLTSLCHNALNTAHERTKMRLKGMPKEKNQNSVKSEKIKAEIIMDNSSISEELKAMECDLLKAEKNAKNVIDLHFRYLPIIDFAYKNRNYNYYLDLCIKYCQKDIDIFPKFRTAYWDDMINGSQKLREHEAHMESLGVVRSEHAQEQRRKHVEHWETLKAENRLDIRIPAFQRLAMILDEQGDIEGAICVCKLALSYNLTDGTKGGFEGRIAKLKKKLK